MDEGRSTFAGRLGELAGRGSDGVCDMVDAILREGLRRNASDIHVDPSSAGLETRFRVDGALQPATVTPGALARNVVARIKVLADLLTYQTDLPQEGRIGREKTGAASDMRVATFPTVLGEKAVVRLGDAAAVDLPLERLGYSPADLEALRQGLLYPQGTILLTGPAGSGKTTTLYAAIRRILEASGRTRHVVTVEDPVERVLAGVTQTETRPAQGLTFARCLRSMLRQDPEVIVVGEIRDRETAEIAIEAGLTGHLVLSAIHSGAAAGVFARLLDMEVPPYLITSSVKMVSAQRLARRLCARCSRVIDSVDGLGGMPADLMGAARQGVGCETCFGSGYAGRLLLAELLVVDAGVRARVAGRASLEEMEAAARAAGMTPLRDAATAAVRAGATSPAEVARVLGPWG